MSGDLLDQVGHISNNPSKVHSKSLFSTACRDLFELVTLALNRRPHELLAMLAAQVESLQAGQAHRSARGAVMTLCASRRSPGLSALPCNLHRTTASSHHPGCLALPKRLQKCPGMGQKTSSFAQRFSSGRPPMTANQVLHLQNEQSEFTVGSSGEALSLWMVITWPHQTRGSKPAPTRHLNSSCDGSACKKN